LITARKRTWKSGGFAAALQIAIRCAHTAIGSAVYALPRRVLAAFALAVAAQAWAHDPSVILQPPREVRLREVSLESAATLTPLSLASADFDRDGYPDLACGYAEGRVSIYFGDARVRAAGSRRAARNPAESLS
jgi:hypothetical protein